MVSVNFFERAWTVVVATFVVLGFIGRKLWATSHRPMNMKAARTLVLVWGAAAAIGLFGLMGEVMDCVEAHQLWSWWFLYYVPIVAGDLVMLRASLEGFRWRSRLEAEKEAFDQITAGLQ
jgi:uncharacterized membrane protein